MKKSYKEKRILYDLADKHVKTCTDPYCHVRELWTELFRIFNLDVGTEMDIVSEERDKEKLG